jgi:hypothetical protein
VHEVNLRGTLEFIVGKEIWLLLVITPLLLFPNPLTVVALPLIPAIWLARWPLKGYLTVRIRTPFRLAYSGFVAHGAGQSLRFRRS